MKRSLAKQANSSDGKVLSSRRMPEKSMRMVAGVLKLLSDESRLQLLYHLSEHTELHVTNLCRLLGQSQPAVSHHLALLRVAGVISVRREGKHNYYSICVPFFGDFLREALGAKGGIPKKLRIGGFILQYLDETS